ncbi:hypothetical protein CBI55_16625 [Pseudomonas syringae]|nr:hypothetical protein CBI55_16625 [Pseudomonas syringae]
MVGVSLLTKALVQTPYLRGLHRPLREQARSHENLCVTLSAEHVAGTYRSSRSVGMHFVTLRVTATCCIGLDRNLCGSELAHEDFGPNAIFPGAAPASSRASSLPRKLVCNAERGACGHLSFLTLWWECSSRRSASPRGRRASGKAYDAERRTIVEVIVPHAPAWECRS